MALNDDADLRAENARLREQNARNERALGLMRVGLVLFQMALDLVNAAEGGSSPSVTA